MPFTFYSLFLKYILKFLIHVKKKAFFIVFTVHSMLLLDNGIRVRGNYECLSKISLLSAPLEHDFETMQ